MSLSRQTLWSLLPILLTSVIGVVSVPLYYHLLGDKMYALWFYVQTLSGMFGFMDLGMGVAVGRFIGVALGRNDQNGIKEYWSTGNTVVLPLVFFFAVLFIILGTIFGPAWFKLTGAEITTLRYAVIFGGVSLFFGYYGQMWHVLSQVYLDFKFLSILRSSYSLTTSIGSLVVGLLTKSVPCIMAFTMLATIIQFAAFIHRGNQQYQLPVTLRDYRIQRLKEMLPYTLKTFGQLMAGSIFSSIDRLILGRLGSSAEFAAYNVGQNIGSRVQYLSTAAMGPIFANTSRGMGGDGSRSPDIVYRQAFNLLAPWFSLIAVWIAVWHGPLLNFWLNDNAFMVSKSFAWIVGGCCIASVANISQAQLGSFNKVGTSLWFSITAYVSSAVGVLVGWHLAGLTGAGIGFFLSRLIFLLQDIYIRYLARIKLSLMDRNLFLYIVGLAGYMISLFEIAEYFRMDPYWRVALAIMSTIPAIIILLAIFPWRLKQ